MSGDGNIQIEQGQPFDFSGKRLLEYYLNEIRNIGIDSYNNLSRRYKNSYGILTGALTPFDNYIPYRIKRALALTIGEDRKNTYYKLVDPYTSSWHPWVGRVVFYAFIVNMGAVFVVIASDDTFKEKVSKLGINGYFKSGA